MAYFAGILGKEEEQAAFEALAEEIRENYNELGTASAGVILVLPGMDHKDEICMTQAAEALPLYWGMVPADREADGHMRSGSDTGRKGAFVSGEVGSYHSDGTQIWHTDLICRSSPERSIRVIMRLYWMARRHWANTGNRIRGATGHIYGTYYRMVL